MTDRRLQRLARGLAAGEVILTVDTADGETADGETAGHVEGTLRGLGARIARKSAV